jgi:hypothetical protein
VNLLEGTVCSKMERNHNARQFLRELLMYRYSQLLLTVEKHYPMTEEQKRQIYRNILNIRWVEQALPPPTPYPKHQY